MPLTLVLSLLCTIVLCGRFNQQLTALQERSGVVLRSQSSGDEGGGDSTTYQRIRRAGGGYDMQYGFVNFNRDPLAVALQISRGELAEANGEFGFTQKDLDELSAWHNAARDRSYQQTVNRGGDQAAVNAAAAAVDQEYKKRMRAYMASKGFKLLQGGVADVDVPNIVKHNRARLSALAQVFDKIATDRRYDSESLVGAVSAMIQTSILYKIPPTTEGERHIGGLLPPLTTLTYGWGDCDTKACLLGTILTNWPQMRMVGVALPEHYLAAILRIPNKGDVYIEYEGLQYVLIEAAGPAWIQPGTVANETLALMQGQSYDIEPFF